MTNKEKFREVFGFTPDFSLIGEECVIPEKICLEQDGCDECVFKKWWSMEYKECFKIKEKYDD